MANTLHRNRSQEVGLGEQGLWRQALTDSRSFGRGDCPMVVSFVLMAFAKAFMGVIDLYNRLVIVLFEIRLQGLGFRA